MSENHLDWLSRVSQEDATNTSVSIKPEGVDPKGDEAADHVGGDEKSTAQGSDSANNHEIVLNENMEPDDNADAKKADGEIGVAVSKESGTDPDFRIDLQTGGPVGGKPSTEDGETEEEDETELDADAQTTDEPGAEGAVAGDTPAAVPDAGETTVAENVTEPEVGAAGETGPAVADDAGEIPAAPELPSENEAPVTEGAGDDVATLTGAEAPAVPEVAEGQVLVAIDPVTEIKEGLRPAVDEAQGQTDGLVPATGDEQISQEGFGGGLLGFLAGGFMWTPFVGAGVSATAKVARLKLQQDIEKISKRIAAVRKGDLEDAKKNGTKVPKGMDNVDFVTVLKSALLGQFFGSFYGAHQGSELQNLNNELQAKLKQLKAEMEKAGISNEDYDLVPEDDGEQQDTEFDGVADDGIMQPVEQTLDDVRDIGAMQVAVENYADILRSVDARGQAADPLLVRSIQIGLRAFQGEGLAEGQPSVEDFKDGANQFVLSQELMSDIKGKATIVGEAMTNAIKKLMQMLMDTVQEINSNSPALREKNKALLERLGAVKGEAQGKVPVGGAARLLIGSNFAGDKAGNYTDLQKYADRFLVDYPNYWNGVSTKLFQLFMQDKEGGKVSLADIAEIIGQGYQPGMFGLTQTNDVPNADRYDNNFASPTLLGNRKVVVHLSKAGERHGVSALSDVFSVELASVEASGQPSVDVMLPDTQSLRQILTALDKLIAQVPRYAEAGKKMASNQQTTKVLTHRLLIGAAGEHGASALAASMTKPTGAMVGHVVNTIKVAHKFVEHCIAQHEGASK